VNLPPHLLPLFQTICSSLQSCAPQHLSSKDCIGWGFGSYLVHPSYEALLAHSTLPPKSKVWNRIWASDSLPNINILCLKLTHGKILTGGNLQKRGFNDLFRCALCSQAAETFCHIFLECPYAKFV